MLTAAALDRLFARWLSDHEETPPDDRALVTWVATLPAEERAAARVYARGFLRGCAYCTQAEGHRREADLRAIESDLDAIRVSLGVAMADVRELRSGEELPG